MPDISGPFGTSRNNVIKWLTCRKLAVYGFNFLVTTSRRKRGESQPVAVIMQYHKLSNELWQIFAVKSGNFCTARETDYYLNC